MKYFLLLIIITYQSYFTYLKAHTQKKIYINSNIELKKKTSNTNFYGGEEEILNLSKLEPIIGYSIESKSSTINIGFILYGKSKFTSKYTTTRSESKETIKAISYGVELSYIFKLLKTENRHPFYLGFGVSSNYQYIIYHRTLDSYFSIQDDIHINENLKSAVLSTGIFITVEQKLSKKIGANFNIGNRFYLPFNNAIYSYANNHFLISLGVNYKF